MNELKDQFLELAVIQQKKYDEIAELLKVDKSVLSKMWDEYKTEREYLASIRKIWQNKFEDVQFHDFKNWYENTPHKCHYCDITEAEINQLLQSNKISTKRNRGKKLEIDRKEPDAEYDNLNNLVFSCYWCNNAKTDTFSADEFMEVGKAIKNIWQKKLNE